MMTMGKTKLMLLKKKLKEIRKKRHELCAGSLILLCKILEQRRISHE